MILGEYIEYCLHANLPPCAAELSQIIEYAIFPGGKRIRPTAMCVAAEAFGSAREFVIRAACAIEILHGVSLMLDDLPCMDDATIRRGKPACHLAFGEANVILASHLMTYHSFNLIIQNAIANDLDTTAIGQIGAMVTHFTAELVAGQYVDINGANQIEHMYRQKTAALFELALLLTGFLTRRTSDELGALQSYATHLGIAFQIRDDVLDRTGTVQEIGKDVGLDKDKTTFVMKYGIKKAGERIEQHLSAAAAHLHIFGAQKRFFANLLQ